MYYTEIKNIHFSHVDFFLRTYVNQRAGVKDGIAIRLALPRKQNAACIGRTTFFRRSEIYMVLSCNDKLV